jgi:hypothetical protein
MILPEVLPRDRRGSVIASDAHHTLSHSSCWNGHTFRFICCLMLVARRSGLRRTHTQWSVTAGSFIVFIAQQYVTNVSQALTYQAVV